MNNLDLIMLKGFACRRVEHQAMVNGICIHCVDELCKENGPTCSVCGWRIPTESRVWVEQCFLNPWPYKAQTSWSVYHRRCVPCRVQHEHKFDLHRISISAEVPHPRSQVWS